jgi:anthranilate phosphoribosyltransferase
VIPSELFIKIPGFTNMASKDDTIVITSLLKRLWPAPSKETVTTSEIAEAISHIFTNSLSPVQTGALLTALHFTGLDRHADVLAECAAAMRSAAAQIDHEELAKVVERRGRKEGSYHGGLVRNNILSNQENCSDFESAIL